MEDVYIIQPSMDLTDFSIKNKNFTFCDSKVLKFVSWL